MQLFCLTGLFAVCLSSSYPRRLRAESGSSAATFWRTGWMQLSRHTSQRNGTPVCFKGFFSFLLVDKCVFVCIQTFILIKSYYEYT